MNGGVGMGTVLVVVIVALWLVLSIKILNEYERAVVFRLGRLLDRAKGPGIAFVFFPIDRMMRVSLRTVVHDVPPQDVITRDNVSVKVNAVVYYRVIDPRRAVVEVEQYHYADRKSTRLNSSHVRISYAVFCLKKKKKTEE